MSRLFKRNLPLTAVCNKHISSRKSGSEMATIRLIYRPLSFSKTIFDYEQPLNTCTKQNALECGFF